MVQIKKQLVSGSTKVNKGTNNRVGIAIHETANTSAGAGAQAHANLQSKGNVRQASWHYSVDDQLAVQSFPHTARCWHAGDGAGPGNNQYIAIEICVNSDGNYVQACKNAADLVRQLQADGIGTLLKQHNAFSGKDCPNFMREGRDGVTWEVFQGWVANGTGSEPASGGGSPAPTPPTPSAPTNRDGSLTIAQDGVRGPQTISRWQEVMGTPIDGTIDKKNSSLIKADQAFLNSVVAPTQIRDLTGKDQLDVDGVEGKKTVIVRQFWLRNVMNPQHQINLIGHVLEFDGILGPETNTVHQFALNNTTSGSKRYGQI